MEGYEIDECLNSMSVLVDSREQPSERATKRYEAFGCPFSRHKLDYGDYTFNFEINGKSYYQPDDEVKAPVVIERKENLTELSGNLCQNRERFAREFQRALKNNAKVYLLVEDATYENMYNGRYRTKFNPAAYTASFWAFCARYHLVPVFCKSETSGKIIHDILYRELKERLERGEFDCLIKGS